MSGILTILTFGCLFATFFVCHRRSNCQILYSKTIKQQKNTKNFNIHLNVTK